MPTKENGSNINKKGKYKKQSLFYQFKTQQPSVSPTRKLGCTVVLYSAQVGVRAITTAAAAVCLFLDGLGTGIACPGDV
jgi:hypothetical protein